MLAFRLESAGPELGVGTASEGLRQHSLFGLGQLRGIRVDICGDQDDHTECHSQGNRINLSLSSLACRVGSFLRTLSETPCWGSSVTLTYCSSLLSSFPKVSPWQPLLVWPQMKRFSLFSFPQLQCFARSKLHPHAGSSKVSPVSWQ